MSNKEIGKFSNYRWSDALWWCTNTTRLLRSVAHDLAVNSARDAIVQLVVELGQSIS